MTGRASAHDELAFLSTVHDPAGRLLTALDERGDCVGSYRRIHVAVTDATDPRVSERLRARDAIVEIRPPGSVGAAMRSVLGAAVTAGHAAYFYCDLDRWLHWAGSFPDELDGLPGLLAARWSTAWYVCIGRTARAFATHPPVQRAAEAATNRALSLAARRRLDATAGACWLSREGAKLVLAGSTEQTKATDLEWPALILKEDRRRLGGVTLEGLEFETAEFHGPEVAAAGGIAAWLRLAYDRPEVWRDRLRLAADSVDALTRVLGQ
ncbi:MAG: hypothetical protein QOF01_1228 [Thermomicrobiales bacterium]|nr:hypothetical protein [Thermomicrobiales bacterium]